MNKALDLLREIRPSIPKEVLELWCKDRDAFLASHPAVEQAGGDERAKFEYWASDEGIYPKAVERSGNCYKLAQTQSYWMAWQARAALAQPSPKCSTCGGTGMVDDGEIDCYSDGTPFENGPVKCVKDCPACKAQPSPAQAEQPTADDYEEVLADHRRLVREMDVLLNGEAYAAKQAMLCDLVSQVEAEVRKSGQPLLVSAERYRWLRNDDNWGADDSEGQGTSKWANLGELSGTDFDAYLDQLRGYNPVMDIDPEHSKAIAKRGRDAIVAQAEGAPVIGCLCGMPMTEGRHSPGGCTSLKEFAPHLSAQAQAKQAEQPEVVARVDGTDEDWFIQPEDETEMHNEGLLFSGCELGRMIDFDRIVGELRADRDSWAEQAEQRLADWDEMRKERDAALVEVERLRESKGDPVGSLEKCMKVMYERDEHAKRLEVALARVAELERQEPVVRAYGVLPPFAEKVLAKLRRFYDCAEDFESGGVDIGRHWLDLLTQLGLLDRVQRSPALWEISQQGEDLLEAPVAQAQHSVPDGASDLCRFLAKLYCELDGLRYSTAKLPAEQIADALIFKWPVLQGARNQLNIKRISEQPYDESKLHSAIAAMLAAAPGNSAQHSVPEGWMLMPVEPLLNMMSDKDHDTRITAERQLLSILAAAPGKEVGHE
ncbi:hypothetical protein ISE07_26080 [Pseudomonas aeruginosa]|nr:hypothetical protein [Pseudomonas aeruginosa]